MTYYILYTESFDLVGVTINEPVPLPGISIKQVDELVPDLNKSVWDKDTIGFIDSAIQLTKLEFLTRFTIAERTAIRASTDPIVMDFMQLLNIASYVDLTDQNTINGVGYLAMIGLIDSSRVSEILA